MFNDKNMPIDSQLSGASIKSFRGMKVEQPYLEIKIFSFKSNTYIPIL